MNRAENSPDRPLDVWFVCNAWTGGGAERVASTIVQHLDRDIVQPSVCLLRNDMSYPLPEDVEVHHLDYRGLPTFFSTARRLRRLVNDRRPDVVVSTVNANALLTGAALKRSTHSPPWIARIGSSPRHHDRGLRGISARSLYRNADRFIANSERLTSDVASIYPFTSGRVSTIRNACDFEVIDHLAKSPTDLRPPDGPLLAAVGRLVAVKRYDMMLEALAIVRRNIPASLWVCGEGPARKDLERQTGRLRLGDAVRWMGFTDNPYAVIRSADLYVLTSDYEGSPNSLIEAQSLGLAAVSTRCDYGPDEIISDGVSGLLTPPGNANEFAKAVVALLSDGKKRAAYGLRAKEAVRHKFALKPIIDKWHAVLQALSGSETRSGTPDGNSGMG
ncbi:MAG: glycosyltransferase [Candidatus Latescibacterota bacterium]|nr:MAG: glycosyltransferase [Candidatus Latescibacterota bacterium]